MGVRFMPTENFPATVNGHTNSYLKGAIYTVHDTPTHHDLARKCQKWAEQGLVIIVGRTNGASVPGHISQR